MSGTKRVAVMWLAVSLAILSSGCTSTFENAGRSASKGAFDGLTEAAQAWYDARKPILIEEARKKAGEVGEKLIDQGGAALDAKIAEKVAVAQGKQERGEPLSKEDWLWLIIAGSGIAGVGVSGAKGALRKILGLKIPVERIEPPKP